MVKLRHRKIVWDNEAKHSLRSIYEYIKNKESPTVAKRVRGKIIEQVKTIASFPEKFQREPFLKDEPGDYRYKVIWSYKIIYETTPSTIFILDIFHTSRNPSNIKISKN